MWFVTIAWKNLRQRKVRSLLTCLGMAVSVCAVASLIGVSQGFEEALAAIFQRRGVDILVSRAQSPNRLVATMPVRLADRIRQVPGVDWVEPILMDIVSFNRSDLMAVYVAGWVPGGAMFDDLHLSQGRVFTPSEPRGTVVGTTLARSLNKGLGDTIEIDGGLFTVTGIFQSKNMFEDATAIVPLGQLQELTGRRKEATVFAVRLDESKKAPEDVAAIGEAINRLRGDQGELLNINAEPTVDHIKSNMEFRIMNGLTWSMSAVALLIGAIGVFNTMMISVFERTREIGTLLAVGWERRRIAGLVLLESLLLAMVGVVVGIVMSLVVMSSLSSLEFLSTIVPASAPPGILLEASLVGLLTGVVGAMVPAIHASRLLPTEALRYE